MYLFIVHVYVCSTTMSSSLLWDTIIIMKSVILLFLSTYMYIFYICIVLHFAIQVFSAKQHIKKKKKTKKKKENLVEIFPIFELFTKELLILYVYVKLSNINNINTNEKWKIVRVQTKEEGNNICINHQELIMK